MATLTKSAKEIFVKAIEEYAPSQWPEFLNEACGGDASLRQRVGILLQAHAGDESLLDRPAIAPAATLDRATEHVGTIIGPYKLLEQIGEGGMGLVYMAEQQQPVRRLVALKLIKPGMDSKQVIARFEAERQALAMMEHPYIAKIFDAGTVGERKDEGGRMKDEREPAGSSFSPHPSSFASARPYFVMELVRGVPLNEFCEQKRLTVRERLQLFIQVCQAVQHAHQKGIIHRDLKPTNVLVTMADAAPFPKLLDFGIAKALGGTLARCASEGNTLYTGFSQLVGTPLYMSPEQAEMNLFGVDTRSDVYSLGVMLYELLTGTTPFDKERLKSAGFDEMRRIIREEEPETVSARIAKTRRVASVHENPLPRGEGGRRPGEGVPQSTSPATSHQPLATRLSELDWIVMKALEKDRTRRYESASALAADIQRYLSDEPVHAHPPTTMYRFHKFARKHQPALVTAAAIALCLLLGTTVSAWQAVRATTAEAQANANEQRAAANAANAVQKEQEAIKQRDEVKALADQLRRTLYASNMNLAKAAWDAGMIARVKDLLDQHRPQPGETDLRGFEWHYLHKLCHSELLTLPGGIGGMAFSPDGKRLASAVPGNGPVKVWDAQTGQELLTLQGAYYGVAFSSDGKRLATCGGTWDHAKKDWVAGELKVWNAQTGQELLAWRGHTSIISSVAFSPDGKRLASGSGDWDSAPKPGELKVWDAQTGQELLTLTGHAGPIISVAFSPDGKRLASGSNGDFGIFGGVKVWDAQSGAELLSLNDIGLGTIVAFSADGKRLATDRHVWDVETGKQLLSLAKDFPSGIASGIDGGILDISPDGKRLAFAHTEAGVIQVRDAETGAGLLTFKGHTGPILGALFSPDGKKLASRSLDRTIKVWDATTSQEARTITGDNPGAFGAVALSPDFKRVTYNSHRDPSNRANDADVVMKICDAQTGQEYFSLKGHGNPRFRRVAFSPDGKRLAFLGGTTE